MQPANAFRRALLARRQQIGLWCTLSSPYVTELVAGSGFDWLLIDTEHSPTEVADVLSQLQAAAPYPGSVVVRPASNDPVLIKRLLDLGAQTLLVPYVQNAQEAQQAVRSMRYAPRGIRGVSALTRATRFGRVARYSQTCEEDLCLVVQVETVEALAEIESIAGVEGVDAIFVGPADLAATMGLAGQPSHPEVVAAVDGAIRRIVRAGKPAGVLTPDEGFARKFIEAGSTFTAVGIDAGLLARESAALAKRFSAASPFVN
ncbi:MAG TPA: aldolase/citrate lyase family protein [Ramlibacter sp.]|nr:aldolase/citrate lyase family protein [Ramlibacter sp.]